MYICISLWSTQTKPLLSSCLAKFVGVAMIQLARYFYLFQMWIWPWNLEEFRSFRYDSCKVSPPLQETGSRWVRWKEQPRKWSIFFGGDPNGVWIGSDVAIGSARLGMDQKGDKEAVEKPYFETWLRSTRRVKQDSESEIWKMDSRSDDGECGRETEISPQDVWYHSDRAVWPQNRRPRNNILS